MTCPDTQGIHHVGLTVTDLESSCRFFTDLLGWDRVAGDLDYPAVFVSDGSTMITLWQTEDPHKARLFDKNNHVGLHHLAKKVANWMISIPSCNGLKMSCEFAPERLRNGPAMHMMCYEPGGIRVEFIVPA